MKRLTFSNKLVCLCISFFLNMIVIFLDGFDFMGLDFPKAILHLIGFWMVVNVIFAFVMVNKFVDRKYDR